MKRMKLAMLTGVMAAAISIALAATVARAGGCLQVPGPRCTYLTCADSGGSDCSKTCTQDPAVGWGPCLSGGNSEDKCDEITAGGALWQYDGECQLDGTCLYGPRTSISSSGSSDFSKDTSPCGV